MVITGISIFLLVYGLIILTSILISSIKSKSLPKPLNIDISEKAFITFIRIFIELVTPFALIAGSFMLYSKTESGLKFSLFSLLALLYYSLKRFHWEGLSKDTVIMGTFIFIGFLGSSISIVLIMLKIY